MVPPPKPPPAPPPPLPFFSGGENSTKVANHCAPASDRNALLSQIRKGANLKKVETNDRSSPLVTSSAAKQPSAANVGRSNSICISNGPSPLIPPGGLFAHGMPRLRSTVNKNGDNEKPFQDCSSLPIESAFGALNVNDTGGSHSQPPSPALKARHLSQGGVQRSLTQNAGHRNFSSDMSNKGPAPMPPPADQKPNFSSDNKKQASVRRSVSQTSLGPKVRPVRPPPNIRPPPPPKSGMTPHMGPPPPPPSKPPNVLRRQSFGVGDTAHLAIFNHHDGMSKLSANKITVPPPPPRNNSAPYSLDKIPNASPRTVHVNKMSIAPPPPPSLRPGNTNWANVSVRPAPPPPVRAPAPPPPPPHRFVAYPAPPSQMKAVAASQYHSGAAPPPPPPTRISSVMSSHTTDSSILDFEARFSNKFRNLQNLPMPEKFSNGHKVYPSIVMKQKLNIRRQPPPPPPMNSSASGTRSGHHQPMLHIQLESRVFANNTAHC